MYDKNTQNFIFYNKDSSLDKLKTTSDDNYSFQVYGEEFQKLLPLSSSINVQVYEQTSEAYTIERSKVYALRNILDRKKIKSGHFSYNSNYGDKSKQKLTLISIPSIFYGSSIKKGSVDLIINYTGSLAGRLQDNRLNGELIETYGSNTGSVAGVVLYDEGFIVLTGSWYVNNDCLATWNSFSTGSLELLNSGSFDVNFEGTNEIQTITMMAHADKGELNHSNNPTYIKYKEKNDINFISSSFHYYENEKTEIKNITKYNYDNFSGSLEKQTYISKIGIYDGNKNLIAVAKLATPIRKSLNRDLTFKLKLDI